MPEACRGLDLDALEWTFRTGRQHPEDPWINVDLSGDLSGHLSGDLSGGLSPLGLDFPRDFPCGETDNARRTTEGDQEAVADCEFRLGQASLATQTDHVARAGTHALDVLGEIERLRQQRVGRNGAMGLAELRQCQRRRQRAGIPDLQPISEQHDLHAAAACVVAMRHCIHDGFPYRRGRELIGDRCLGALGTRAHGEVQLREHEVHGLVHEGRGLGTLVEWKLVLAEDGAVATILRLE